MRRSVLIVLAAASIMLPLTGFSIAAWQLWQGAMATADHHVRATADMLQEHAAKVFETEELVLDLVDARVAGMSWDDIAAAQWLTDELQDLVRRYPQLGSLWLADADGVLRNGSMAAPSRIIVDDRDYFQALKRTATVYVSETVWGRVTGVPGFSIARRRSPTSHFHGVLIATTFLPYFETVFAQLAREPGEAGGLVRGDGALLARYPPLSHPVIFSPDSDVMRALKGDAGVFRTVSQGDGVERLWAFKQLPHHAVYAVFGVPVSAVLSAWRRQVTVGAVIAALATGLLLTLMGLLAQQSRRNRLVQAALEAAVAERTHEVELRAAQAEAAEARMRRAEEAKTRFFAAASHDLRQPLQALRLFIDLLSARLAGSPHHVVVGHAATALTSAQTLLNDLLDVARLDSGTIVVKPRTVDLSDLLSPIADEFAPLAEDKGLYLRRRLVPAIVTTDPALLERMVRNLLANAVRYTDSGGILLAIRHRGAAVAIEVWDTGPGIAPDKQELVWREFYQGQDRSQGLGLGLAIVRRLADTLGITVTLSSRPGRGTMFRVVMAR